MLPLFALDPSYIYIRYKIKISVKTQISFNIYKRGASPPDLVWKTGRAQRLRCLDYKSINKIRPVSEAD